MTGRIYFYKLVADNGGAPCVSRGLLSLAICKPAIRRTAQVGDLIFGFAANSLHRDNRLLYVARVTKTLENGNYYEDPRYARRGDCIYCRIKRRFVWRKGSRHHGPRHLIHDLGKYPKYPDANVILSDDFRYFGGSGTDHYKTQYPLVGKAVEQLGRGHRIRHDPNLSVQLHELATRTWTRSRKMVMGEPTSAPSRRVCHRSRAHCVVDR